MSTHNRGQAALEYLVTYGWGFLVILVVVGALAYFGFLNPTKYLPDRCNFGAQLECQDFKLEGKSIVRGNDGVVTLRLRNNFGDDITIIQLQTPSGQTLHTVGSDLPLTVKKGTTSLIGQTYINMVYPPLDDCYGTDQQLIVDDRTAVQFIITFRRASGGPLHNVTGEVFGTVQAQG